jgi:hypothetical protein
VQDWPREKAIAELTDPRHGHHADVFPNIREYLETVDVEKIRRQVGRPLGTIRQAGPLSEVHR